MQSVQNNQFVTYLLPSSSRLLKLSHVMTTTTVKSKSQICMFSKKHQWFLHAPHAPSMRFLFSFIPMRFSFCKRHETREPETSSTRFANSVLAIACTTSFERSACHAKRRKLQLAPLSHPPKHLLRSLRSQSRRQRKRHLKINIWEKVTILWLQLLPRTFSCWQSTLQMDW